MDVFFHHLGIVGGNGPLSGASCGALIAVFTRCGLPVEIVVRLTRAFAQVWCADRLLKWLHDTCMPLAHWKRHPCSPKPTRPAPLLLTHIQDCATNGVRGRLGTCLRSYLDTYLPPNAHELCDGNTFLAVTKGVALQGGGGDILKAVGMGIQQRCGIGLWLQACTHCDNFARICRYLRCTCHHKASSTVGYCLRTCCCICMRSVAFHTYASGEQLS